MKPTLIEWPGKVVQVIEKEHGESRSRFMAMRPAAVKQPANARCLNDMIPVAFTLDCETDDSECCTKALRLVSGSDTAVHPRDWATQHKVDVPLEDAAKSIDRYNTWQSDSIRDD
jgi:hypothetical protein